MPETPTDAIMLLKADHRAVAALFAAYEKAGSENEKSDIAHQICTELKVHTQIEEELFYPAFKGLIPEAKIAESLVEHDGAKMLVNDLEQDTPAAPYFDAKIKVLSEEVKHHVEEEEQPVDGLFAQCRKTDVDLVALRDAMMARKDALLGEAQDEGLPAAHYTTVNLVAA